MDHAGAVLVPRENGDLYEFLVGSGIRTASGEWSVLHPGDPGFEEAD